MFNPQIFILSISLNIVGAALFTAVLFVVLWSSWKERVNQLLAIYVSICLLWSLSALTVRIITTTANWTGQADSPPFFLIYLIVMSLAGNSPFLFAFVIEYVGMWGSKILRIACGIAFAINVGVALLLWKMPTVLLQEYDVTQNGMLMLEPAELALPIIGVGYFFWYGFSLYLLYRYAWPRGKWVAFGAVIIAAGLAVEIATDIADILPTAIVLSGIGSVAYAYAIVQDKVFNPLRQKNEQLVRSQRYLEQTLSAIPGAVLITRLNGEIIWANNESTEILNDSAENILGANIDEVYRNDEELRRIVRALRHDGNIRDREIRYRPQGHEPRWGRLDVVRTEFADEPAHLSILQDIHEQRQAQEALQAMQKWESLALLAGGIAHDFNNLLVAMLGQSTLAKYKMTEDSPGYRHIEKVEIAAQRASKLTNQMLAYSGRGQFEVRLIDFNALIADNLHLCATSVSKNIVLRTKYHAKLPCVEADTAQMQQVIMNLILNAAQAMDDEDGGVIEISTNVRTLLQDQAEGWHLTGEPLTAGNYVSVTVKDNGCGIEKDALSSIFDPFFSTKITGSGLGLAAVLGIIKGHHGGIQVQSQVGVGTQFSLLLPASDKQIAKTPVETVVDLTMNTDIQKILVIDDEPSVTDVLKDILSAENIPAVVTNSGAEGVDIYLQQQASIGLVLLDLTMPGMNGEQVFNALRELNPHVKVILSSGYSQLEATRQFIGRGLAGFMQKPYDLNTFLKTIRPYFPE